jgi:hypothetical protein
MPAEQLRLGYSQRVQDRGLEFGLVVVEAEPHFSQTQHGELRKIRGMSNLYSGSALLWHNGIRGIRGVYAQWYSRASDNLVK